MAATPFRFIRPKDLDLLISPDADNVKSLYAALAEFGASLEGLKAEDFMEPDLFFRMGAPPLMVDILPAIQGVDFESAWERRTDIETDPESGSERRLFLASI